MIFVYRLAGAGWADALLSDGVKGVEIPASDLSDTLGDLLLALSALQEGDDEARASWELEPGEYRWIFNRHGDRLRLRVLAFPDSWPPREDVEGVVVFQTEEPLDDLVTAFASGMRAVLDEWGEDGYLSQWIGWPFPTGLLELVEGREGDG